MINYIQEASEVVQYMWINGLIGKIAAVSFIVDHIMVPILMAVLFGWI